MKQLQGEDGDVLDPVLMLPVYFHQARQWIFGLPRLEHQGLYMVDVPTEPTWDEDQGPYVLECTWGVSYL